MFRERMQAQLVALICRENLDLGVSVIPADVKDMVVFQFSGPDVDPYPIKLHLWPDWCALIKDGEAVRTYRYHNMVKKPAWVAADVLEQVLGRPVGSLKQDSLLPDVAARFMEYVVDSGLRFPFSERTNRHADGPGLDVFFDLNDGRPTEDRIGSAYSLTIETRGVTLVRTEPTFGGGTRSREVEFFSALTVHTSDYWIRAGIAAITETDHRRPTPVWSGIFTVPDMIGRGVGAAHIDEEDGGQALILTTETDAECFADGEFFISLQSWSGSDEDKPYEDRHRIMHHLMGRKIRVTIETLD